MANEKTPAQPATGDNQFQMTPEIFNYWLPRITALEEERRVVSAKLNRERKAARAAGIILGQFDAMRALAELPVAEQAVKLQAAADYLRFLKSPAGSQMNMNFNPTDPLSETDEQALERIGLEAEGAGYRAGLAGIVFEDGNPHTADSPSGQRWLKGYREGQAQNAEALGHGATPRS